MEVSVIIPVYNAERYLRQSVESALSQAETQEVILIEDSSADDSLQVCRELAAEYPQVRLLHHSDRLNHGPGASRNIGIKSAKCKYICFLDADDYFLPDRFSVARNQFEADPTVEGVYEAVGTHFENEAAERRWWSKKSSLLTTMTKRVQPEHLFESQAPIGPFGWCPTGGWVVKRTVFEKTGLFDEHLRLHQDTVMFVKLAAVGRMMPGRLDQPVAMRRVHDHNRSSAPRPAFQVYKSVTSRSAALWKWGRSTPQIDDGREKLLVSRLIRDAVYPYKSDAPRVIRDCLVIGQVALLLIRHPILISKFSAWAGVLIELTHSLLHRKHPLVGRWPRI